MGNDKMRAVLNEKKQTVVLPTKTRLALVKKFKQNKGKYWAS